MEGPEFGITRQWVDLDLQPQGEPVDEQYHDYDFYVADMKLFADNSVLEISPETRLRRVLDRVATVCGGDFEEMLSKPIRDKAVASRKKYLGGRINLPEGQQALRRHLVTKTDAYFAVADKLSKQNHPTVQIMRQVELATNRDGEHNAELWRLWEDVIEATAWPMLQIEYEEQIKDALNLETS